MSLPDSLEAAILEKHRLATMGSFAAKVVHYLNNPLTVVRLHLRYLDERLAAGEATGELAEEAEGLREELGDAVRDMEILVQALRDYVQGDGIEEELELVDCVEAAYQVAGLKIGYGTQLDLERPADPIPIRAVHAHVLQLFTSVFLHVGSQPAELGPLEVQFAAEPEAASAEVYIRDQRPVGISRNVPDGAGEDEFDPELGLALAAAIGVEMGAAIDHSGTHYRITVPRSTS